MKITVILTFISVFGLAFSDEINGDNRNSSDIEEADEVESDVDDPPHRLCPKICRKISKCEFRFKKLRLCKPPPLCYKLKVPVKKCGLRNKCWRVCRGSNRG